MICYLWNNLIISDIEMLYKNATLMVKFHSKDVNNKSTLLFTYIYE